MIIPGGASPLAVALGTALAVAGCGGGGPVESSAQGPQEPAEQAEAQAPPSASPLLKAIYRQFPSPQPEPSIKGSANAIRAGEAACEGKSPVEVRERYLAASRLTSSQRKLVTRIERYERRPTYSFPAGQLGATVYEKSLPKSTLSTFGYQGCLYALARELEARLAR